MPVRIFHKDHGYVLTSDQKEIDMLLAKGGITNVKPLEKDNKNIEVSINTVPPKATKAK